MASWPTKRDLLIMTQNVNLSLQKFSDASVQQQLQLPECE